MEGPRQRRRATETSVLQDLCEKDLLKFSTYALVRAIT